MERRLPMNTQLKYPDDIHVPETPDEHTTLLDAYTALSRDNAHEKTHPKHYEYDVLGLLLDEYDRRNSTDHQYDPGDDPADAVDILKHLMDAQDMKQKDLVDIFGSKSAVSEVIHRRRGITVRQIYALAEKFNVSRATFMP
jgi:HTH-type transcriptional regulator/antitoxin HigA